MFKEKVDKVGKKTAQRMCAKEVISTLDLIALPSPYSLFVYRETVMLSSLDLPLKIMHFKFTS